MNEIVKEWVRKAEGDYATARRELTVTDCPNYDAVCFHAQQCVEKLFKAMIIFAGGLPPKTHDLTQLASLCLNGSWSVEDLHFLTRAAVDYRYPGEQADIEEAAEAMKICERLHDDLLEQLKNE